MNGRTIWLVARDFRETTIESVLPALCMAERAMVWSRPARAAVGGRWIKLTTGGKGENGEPTMNGVGEEVALEAGERQSPAWPN
jgi:hypothetical protein